MDLFISFVPAVCESIICVNSINTSSQEVACAEETVAGGQIHGPRDQAV